MEKKHQPFTIEGEQTCVKEWAGWSQKCGDLSIMAGCFFCNINNGTRCRSRALDACVAAHESIAARSEPTKEGVKFTKQYFQLAPLRCALEAGVSARAVEVMSKR